MAQFRIVRSFDRPCTVAEAIKALEDAGIVTLLDLADVAVTISQQVEKKRATLRGRTPLVEVGQSAKNMVTKMDRGRWDMTISYILRALLCVASLVVMSNGTTFASSSQDKDTKFSAAACPPNCPLD